jgi:hypothetical protein
LLALVLCGDQGLAAVELIDNLDYRFLLLLPRRLRHEQSADPQMRFRAPILRNEGVGSFLHPVMDKPVGASRTLHKLLADSFPQICVNLFL